MRSRVRKNYKKYFFNETFFCCRNAHIERWRTEAVQGETLVVNDDGSEDGFSPEFIFGKSIAMMILFKTSDFGRN